MAVNAGETVDVTYAPPGVADTAGNAVAGFTAHPTNTTPAVTPQFEPGYALSLLKPGFAERCDVPQRQTWVGEWGPPRDGAFPRAARPVRAGAPRNPRAVLRAGRWDIMSDNRASSHMFAWHKWLLGWLNPAQLRGLTSPGSTEAELTPLEHKGALKAVVVPISPSVAYVIEDRQLIGEDIELCDDGVLV